MVKKFHSQSYGTGCALLSIIEHARITRMHQPTHLFLLGFPGNVFGENLWTFRWPFNRTSTTPDSSITRNKKPLQNTRRSECSRERESGREDKERGSYLAKQSHVNSRRKTFRGDDETALIVPIWTTCTRNIIILCSPRLCTVADLKFIRRRRNNEHSIVVTPLAKPSDGRFRRTYITIKIITIRFQSAANARKNAREKATDLYSPRAPARHTRPTPFLPNVFSPLFFIFFFHAVRVTHPTVVGRAIMEGAHISWRIIVTACRNFIMHLMRVVFPSLKGMRDYNFVFVFRFFFFSVNTNRVTATAVNYQLFEPPWTAPGARRDKASKRKK